MTARCHCVDVTWKRGRLSWSDWARTTEVAMSPAHRRRNRMAGGNSLARRVPTANDAMATIMVRINQAFIRADRCLEPDLMRHLSLLAVRRESTGWMSCQDHH